MAFQISLVDCSLESGQHSVNEQETMKRSSSGTYIVAMLWLPKANTL